MQAANFSRPRMLGLDLNVQEVFEELETRLRQYGLWVELHAFHSQFAMTQTHDRAVAGLRGYFERARERFALHDQRMVARGNEFLRQTAEYRFAVVLNFTRLAVHDFLRANHIAAERRSNGLMSQTNAEDGNFSSEALNERHADPGLFGRTRPGGYYDSFGPQILDFVQSHLVIAADF